uniref:Putative secreted protein n=1 Tax=Psorophora albipes TaxID=869069 RepID=T1E2T7_9DIPT
MHPSNRANHLLHAAKMKLFATIFLFFFLLLAGPALTLEKCPSSSTLEGNYCVTGVIANGGCPEGFKYDVASNKCKTAPVTTRD